MMPTALAERNSRRHAAPVSSLGCPDLEFIKFSVPDPVMWLLAVGLG